MVLFSLSVTGMNQGVVISSRQGRTQRPSSEIPGEGGTEEPQPRRRRSRQTEETEEGKKCCSKCVCKPIDADTIDIYARAVFPFTFAVVNVIYWVAYTMWAAAVHGTVYKKKLPELFDTGWLVQLRYIYCRQQWKRKTPEEMKCCTLWMWKYDN